MRIRRSDSAIVIILSTLFSSSLSLAQIDFNYSGYLLEFPIYQHTRVAEPERNFFANISRLRLRPTLQLSENSCVVLEYEAASMYHSTGESLLQSAGVSYKQLADMKWTPVNSRVWNVSHFIDRFYYMHDLKFAEITAGRQRIAWGTGRVWNPTDLFNPINPASFAKVEKDGVDAVLTKLTLGSFTDFSLVYNPTDRWRVNNIGYRFRTNYLQFDFSTMAGLFDRRFLVGGDFAGNFFGSGLRGEGIISMNKRFIFDTFIKYIIGIDYQFSPEFYALAEYHFNGEGSDEKEMYDIKRLAEGKIINVARHYMTIHGSYLIHPLLSASAGWTMNIDDLSHFINAVLSYSVSDEIVISAGGQTFFGEKLSEFWYYPSGLYLKGDIYFGN